MTRIPRKKKVDERRFTVLGRPKAKERPRIWRNMAYTPQATKDYEAKVKSSYESTHADAPLYEGDLAVSLFVVYNKRNHGDLDNVCKSILDGLNKVAWGDDKQVKILDAKMSIDRNDTERVDVTIRPVAPGEIPLVEPVTVETETSRT